MAKWVPLDLHTHAELKHIIGKSVMGIATLDDNTMNAIAAALVDAQGGLSHELSQAWERGVSDHKSALAYPWIESHLVSPYENEVDTDEATG